MKPIRKRLASGVLCIAMAFCLLAANANAANVGFTDVPANHWAKPYIQIASDNGFVTGVGGNQFAPDKSVSPVEFTTMVTRAFFPDAIDQFNKETVLEQYPEAWYTVYMIAAQSKNMLTGTSFDPSSAWATIGTQPLNRYEMAQVILNTIASNVSGIYGKTDMTKAQNSFSDWNSIPEKYREAVAFCYGTGIISGVDGGKFAGSMTMTRAQACTVLVRMDEVINDKDYGLDDNNQPTNPDDNQDNNQNNTGSTATPAYIQERLDALYAKYPSKFGSSNVADAVRWNRDAAYNTTNSKGQPAYRPNSYNTAATDCAAWAWYVSDWIFGDAPVVRVHHNYDEIKIGDVVDMGGTHWCVVIGETGDPVDRWYMTDSGEDPIVFYGGLVRRYVAEDKTFNPKGITVYSRY